MITYILECISIQLVFLLVYDLFLKKETFFQWNRFYLLATFVLSMILPWIKVEALKTTVPNGLVELQTFFLQLDEVVVTASTATDSFWGAIAWEYLVFVSGIAVMLIWFMFKLTRLYRLRKKGSIQYYSDYTKITIPKSSLAFSFFRNVFFGADIPEEKQESIISHELVHVKQMHSVDLIFFELMRIVFWFNPLVYLYQLRISELHEFIADAQASKSNKKQQYELLLSEVFQNQNFSLVNQFYKKSLIKKRIVMMTKEKSKRVYQLKYVLLLPLVLGVLLYTSCENDANVEESLGQNGEMKEVVGREISLAEKLSILNEEIATKEKFTEDEIAEISKMTSAMIQKMNKNAVSINRWNVTTGVDASGVQVPFAVIEEVPVFPGCENAEDKRKCFQEMIQTHIRKNFRYPQEAQAQGIQGRVNVIFIISKEGEITNVRMRGPHKLLEDEAKRIIDRLPKMQPGKQKGHLVEVPFSIPISFKLQ
ncbi:MAG: TonB family protein [Allomuricauda sp.]